MPTYEYLCDSCGNDFDVFQKMADAPVRVCPKCGKPVRRVLSGGIGINFKGAGFYVNDSHAAPKNDASKAASTPSAGNSAGGHTCGGSCCCGSGK